MNKKIAKLGEKTNLTEENVKKLTRIGISGLLALAVAGLTGLGSDAAAQEREMPAKGRSVKARPQKCSEVPKTSDCKAMFTTYYYDQATKKCEEAMGCVTSVFDSKEECETACMGPIAERPDFPVSKYGVISIDDFKNAK